MGLFQFIGDLIDIARLHNATNEMVKNGVLSQDQADDIWSSAADAGRREFHESRQRNSQSYVSYECCSNCKYYSWGECWYFYEGNPGFRYSSYYRPDYHGETRDISEPDDSICDCYSRDYDK